jgi:PAS domain S-box-containing protein
VGVVIDVTDDRTAADRVLRESEEKYRILFEMEPDAIFLIDNEAGQILEVNGVASTLYGYTREELLAKRNVDLSAEPDDTRTATQAHRPRVPVRYHRKKDGTVFPVEITSRFFVWRGREAHIAAIRDITERKQDDDALATRTRQFEAIRETTGEFIRELDLTTLLGLIARRAMELVQASRSIVFLWDEAAGALLPCAWHGYPPSDTWLQHFRLRPGEGVSGTVVQRGQGMIVNDYRTSPHAYPLILQHTNITAILAEPLLYRGRLVGVLVMNHEGEGHRFTEEDPETVGPFARQAAIAIENARAHERALRRGEELEALLRASRTVMAGLDLQTTLEHVVAEASRFARCTQVKLVVVDREAQMLRVGVAHGMPAPPNFPCPIGHGLSGTVAQTGQPLFVPDCQGDPRNHSAAVDRQLGFRTYLGLPIRAGTEVLGVLTFNTTEPRTYSAEELAYLSSFADQAAIALENARLHTAALRRSTELEAILQANQAIQSSLDLTTRLREIVRQAAAIAGASAARMLLLEPDAQILRGHVGVGLPPGAEEVYLTSIPVGESFSGRVAATGVPLVVADTRGDPRLRWPEHVTRYGLVSYLGLPVTFQGTLLGVLVINTTAPRAYTPQEVALLSLFASHAAIAIENARLFQEEQVRRKEVEAVQAVSEEIARELDLTVLLRVIHSRAAALVEADNAAVWLWDEAAQVLTPQSWQGFGPWLADVRMRPGEGVAGTVAARLEGILVNDFPTSPYATPFWLEHSPHVAVLAEPLLYRDRLVGVIAVSRNEPARPFQAENQRPLRLLASQAAIAIENARLVAQLTRSAEELQHARDELVRAETLRALGQMAAGVAHDLNNMLAAVLGQAELLRLRVDDPFVHESLKILETAATDGAHVVRRLQDFARQRTTSPLATVDLAAVVREALEITRPRWQDEPQRQGRVIEVETDLGDLPPTLGHAAEVREVLTNLIANAVDAMPLGGTLTFVGSRANRGVLLAVSDTGIGMSEAIRQRIFEPFFTTKGVKGTGLGLAVAYGIMERNQGAIQVLSAPGRGTTFTLRFQVAPVDLPTREAATPTRPPVPRRILVIDDELVVRSTIVNLLRASGHTVTEAADGTAGLLLLPEASVDLVITDLGMPEVTGWDVARAVKARTPRLPVILLTGWGDQAATGAGDEKRLVDKIVAKPFRLEDLLRAIEDLTAPKGAGKA